MGQNMDDDTPSNQSAFSEADEFVDISLDEPQEKDSSSVFQLISKNLTLLKAAVPSLKKPQNTYLYRDDLDDLDDLKEERIENPQPKTEVTQPKDDNQTILGALQDTLKQAGELTFLSNLPPLLSASPSEPSKASSRENRFLMTLLFPDKLRENGNFKFEMDGKNFLKCVADDADHTELKAFLNNPKEDPNRGITQQWMKLHDLTAQQMEDVVKPILLPKHMKKEQEAPRPPTQEASVFSPSSKPPSISSPPAPQPSPKVASANDQSVSSSLVFRLLDSFVQGIKGFFKNLTTSSNLAPNSMWNGQKEAQTQHTSTPSKSQ